MNIKRRSLRAAMLSMGLAAVLCAGSGVASAQTSGTNSAGSGNQVSVPVTAPINACGNAVAVIGGSLAQCEGGSAVTGGDRNALDGAYTDGRNGLLSGNQAGIPVTAPINACGNAVAAIGGSLAQCEGGSAVTGGDRNALDGAYTDGRNGLLSGNQAGIPVTAPVDVCGNSVAVIGGALASCPGGASVSDEDGVAGYSGDDSDNADDSAVSGVPAPVTALPSTGTRAEDNTSPALPIVGQLPQLPALPIIGN